LLGDRAPEKVVEDSTEAFDQAFDSFLNIVHWSPYPLLAPHFSLKTKKNQRGNQQRETSNQQ